jgi:hypothetical protein
MIFIFNEIKYYQRIQGELCFTEMLKKDTSIYKDGFLRKAGEFDADYIFLSTGYKKNLGLRQMNIGDTLAGYRMIDMTPEMSILKRESVH